MFGAMVRKEGVSAQEFHDHYRHPHGTMGMHITTLREYVQSHQVDTPVLGESQRRFEAVAELWFDNRDDIAHFRQEPTMASYLNEDEPRFLDVRSTRVFVGEEEVLASSPDQALISADPANAKWRLSNRPLSVKAIQFVAPEVGPGWCDDADAEVGRRLGAFRHVRCHPASRPPSVPTRKSRPADFIGCRELWWPTLTAFHGSVAADPQAWKFLVDRPGVHTMVAQAERWR